MPIKLEIISPEHVVLSQDVDMAVLPALEGDIAAMEGHVPMILLLRGGVVELYKDNQLIDRLFVEGGFAEMKETQCTVLAKDVKKLEELSEEDGYQRLAALDSQYTKIMNGMDAEAQRELIDEMRSINAIIDLAALNKHHQIL